MARLATIKTLPIVTSLDETLWSLLLITSLYKITPLRAKGSRLEKEKNPLYETFKRSETGTTESEPKASG
jgi:hypothetical protein